MKILYTCSSIKEFNNMVKHVRPFLFTDIECIHNVGGSQYYEYPLFIFTLHHVFRIYFSDNSLSLEVYDRERFMKHIDGAILQESGDPTDFDYICPKAYYPNSGICDMIAIKGIGAKQNLEGFDLIFSDGKHLCVRKSNLVYGTMDSWITE